MSLFNNPNEAERRQNLKDMEDARLAFAQKMSKEGFAPERMLLVSTFRGGLIGLCREESALYLVLGPDFGCPGEFVLERYDSPVLRREEYYETSEGMGGFLGFGKKAARGFTLVLEREEGEVSIPFILEQNSASVFTRGRNPLLSLKRRRGDANIVWDLQPLEKAQYDRVESFLNSILN